MCLDTPLQHQQTDHSDLVIPEKSEKMSSLDNLEPIALDGDECKDVPYMPRCTQ